MLEQRVLQPLAPDGTRHRRRQRRLGSGTLEHRASAMSERCDAHLAIDDEGPPAARWTVNQLIATRIAPQLRAVRIVLTSASPEPPCIVARQTTIRRESLVRQGVGKPARLNDVLQRVPLV